MKGEIKLLLVEDERTLADIIAETLAEKGFDVTIAYDGRQGLNRYLSQTFDVIATDVMMPALDGFSFVEELRRRGASVPVLFLSARSSAEDVVQGFERGGNDYLRKPFAMSELIVRLRALAGRAKADHASLVVELGSYLFDAASQTLRRGATVEKLSGRESELLALLCSRRGEVVPNRTLLLSLWGDDSFFNARSLHVFITKLRHRLQQDPAVRIVNIRGVGYKLLCE